MKFSKMLSKISLLSLSALSLFIFSCRTKDRETVVPVTPVKTYGALTVKVSNEANNQPIVFSSYNYTNAAGNLYKVEMLKYYISNFTLINSDNTERNFMNYKLLDAADPATCQFTFDSVANGNYKAVRFYLGIDSIHNHTGLQQGDLDPINGMIWTWNTGYIFFKHEGNFINDTAGTSFLLYHYGADVGLATVDIPITEFEVKGNNHTMYLKFNLNDLYSAIDTVNFNNNNIHQGSAWSDMPWLRSLKKNFPGSFSFDKVQ